MLFYFAVFAVLLNKEEEEEEEEEEEDEDDDDDDDDDDDAPDFPFLYSLPDSYCIRDGGAGEPGGISPDPVQVIVSGAHL